MSLADCQKFITLLVDLSECRSEHEACEDQYYNLSYVVTLGKKDGSRHRITDLRLTTSAEMLDHVHHLIKLKITPGLACRL